MAAGNANIKARTNPARALYCPGIINLLNGGSNCQNKSILGFQDQTEEKLIHNLIQV